MTAPNEGTGKPIAAGGPVSQVWLHRLLVPALLAVSATLAVSSLLGDSLTYDETSHLTAGMSYLKTGDFRLAPDHPPLGKIWAAWPLLLLNTKWIPADDHGWAIADVLLTGRRWLFELNDGQCLLTIARCMMVMLHLALCIAIYAAGRTLFGPTAGLLALVLAALCPTTLAHGRLVTTDLPITLCATLTWLTFARLLRRVTWPRLLAVAAALGAASISKMSWPLMLPAMAVMAGVAVLQRDPMEVPAAGAGDPHVGPQSAWRPLVRRRDRVGALAIIALLLGISTVVCIWTCYAWRSSMFPTPTPEQIAAGTADGSVEEAAKELASAWVRALSDREGRPLHGLVPAVLRWAVDRRLLPDAYLYGLAWTFETTSQRVAYFMGKISYAGFPWYFPVALLIKTPTATLVLLLAGIVAFVWRLRGRCGDPALLAGLLAFLLVYGTYVIHSSFNIGHRHLLPVYPVLYVLAGPSAEWLKTRWGRWLIAAALVWLAAANCYIYPHYLSYFNEFIGGPANGHRYLADSNLDWGQDLKRLARYAQQHPGETVKLSYFGSAVPAAYGFDCQLLPGSIETGSIEPLDGGGLYVISVTHWLGVYDRYAQDSFWEDPRWREYYRVQTGWLALPPQERPVSENATKVEVAELERKARDENQKLRWGRFVFNLRRRPPPERIGYSLFVYWLTAADIDDLTRP